MENRRPMVYAMGLGGGEFCLGYVDDGVLNTEAPQMPEPFTLPERVEIAAPARVEMRFTARVDTSGLRLLRNTLTRLDRRVRLPMSRARRRLRERQIALVKWAAVLGIPVHGPGATEITFDARRGRGR